MSKSIFIRTAYLAIILLFFCASCRQSTNGLDISVTEVLSETKDLNQFHTDTPKYTVTPSSTITPKPTEINSSLSNKITSTATQLDNQEEKCPNLLPSNDSNKTNEILGKIYLWNSYPGGYYIYDIGSGFGGLQEILPVKPRNKGPNEAIIISFANFSQQLAYLVKNEKGYLELRLSDLDICQEELVWVDTEKWLGDATEIGSNNIADLDWGPSDGSIIIKSRVIRPHLAVYSLRQKEIYLGSGDCNQIVTLPDTNKWTIGCSLENEAGSYFGIIDLDGKIHVYDSEPYEDTYSVIDWSISPDQQHSVFIANNNSIYIANILEEPIQLPIYWDEEMVDRFWADTKKDPLRISLDGEYVLVFGYETTGELCPKGISILSGDPYEQPCWFLIDMNTGNLQWWLEKKDIENILPWDGLTTLFEAALSPDNKWVSIFLMHPPLRSFLLISVEGNEVKNLGDFITEKIFWGTN